MTTDSIPVPASPTKVRPGLLVEDRNSAVRTSTDGAQTVVKTADRAAEAARQGVSESQV